MVEPWHQAVARFRGIDSAERVVESFRSVLSLPAHLVTSAFSVDLELTREPIPVASMDGAENASPSNRHRYPMIAEPPTADLVWPLRESNRAIAEGKRF